MKILLIGFTKLAYMPYMNFYLSQVANQNNDVHLLYWNRDEKEEIPLSYNVKLHEFKQYQEDEVAKIRKIRSFLKFRKNALSLLRKEQFDLVIVMHTIPGVLLYDVLKKHYFKKYILDYRDVTFEGIGLYKKIIDKLVHGSSATFVSSNAFRSILPKTENIYTTHNILLDSLEHRDIRRNIDRDQNPIRIRYWGFIRHESINKTLIERLANDNRFELHFHGREQETANNLKNYCITLNIKNVFFHGAYEPKERYQFGRETDLLHNIYENDSTTTAMGNKFYDGVTLYIPQICNKGSYMGEQVSESNIGLECDLNEQKFADNVYDFYTSIKWKEFESNCDKKLREILTEYETAKEVVSKIIENESILKY
ncbi:glycosyltransferase [Litchfieldia alkalitelluris]|uniref:glycosyltransferase n=1 Tax=Litchfieldia alkalitelluris TaxID=304268 RepID=UPI0009985A4D|nr:glycosyltransferase [Litchfieldia alkalitelluris]